MGMCSLDPEQEQKGTCSPNPEQMGTCSPDLEQMGSCSPDPKQMGTCSCNPRTAARSLRRRTPLPSSGGAPAGEAQAALGTGARRAGSLTCWAALSASSANSTESPFSACLRDPHVLLCRAAQEGSGVVSDPKALGKRNTQERDTQGLELGPPSARTHHPRVTRTSRPRPHCSKSGV